MNYPAESTQRQDAKSKDEHMLQHSGLINCRRMNLQRGVISARQGTRQQQDVVLHVQKMSCLQSSFFRPIMFSRCQFQRTWIPPLISRSISVPRSSASVPTAVALHRRRLLGADFVLTASTEPGAVVVGIATSG